MCKNIKTCMFKRVREDTKNMRNHAKQWDKTKHDGGLCHVIKKWI